MKTPTSPEGKAGALDPRLDRSTTTQGRKAPAYQEYASDMIARLDYRTLTLPQRGLLYSMRLECWVNQFLPDAPGVLARILGFDAAEVAAEIPYVMPFFACENGRISAPDLEAYREHLEERHKRQSAAAKATNEKRWGPKTLAAEGNSGGIAKRSGKRNDERIGKRIASGSLLSREEPSLPSQGDDGLLPTTSIGEWGGFTDFTQDPDEDGGAE
jgi:hypothetical protein